MLWFLLQFLQCRSLGDPGFRTLGAEDHPCVPRRAVVTLPHPRGCDGGRFARVILGLTRCECHSCSRVGQVRDPCSGGLTPGSLCPAQGDTSSCGFLQGLCPADAPFPREERRPTMPLTALTTALLGRTCSSAALELLVLRLGLLVWPASVGLENGWEGQFSRSSADIRAGICHFRGTWPLLG